MQNNSKRDELYKKLTKDLQSGQYARVEQDCIALLKHYKTISQLWVFLGEALFRQGYIAEAERVFQRALLLDPRASWENAVFAAIGRAEEGQGEKVEHGAKEEHSEARSGVGEKEEHRVEERRSEAQVGVGVEERHSEVRASVSYSGGKFRDDIEQLLHVPVVTVSAAMIVKDEERCIERCIESIRDAVDEIIVLDTGSTDRTIELLQQYPEVKVYHTPWQNDFAHARNTAMSYVTSHWVIWLDADEYLHPDDVAVIKEAAGLMNHISAPAAYLVGHINTNHHHHSDQVASKVDALRTDSTRTDSSGSDSTRTDSSGMDSTRTESSGMDSTRTDSSGTDSTRTDSSGSDSTRTDSSGSDSTRTDTPHAATYSVVRFFAMRHQLRFWGKVHEQVGEQDGLHKTKLYGHALRIRLYHDGYEPSIIQSKNKLNRNIELLKDMVNESPYDPAGWANLGREMMATGDLDSAMRILLQAEKLALRDERFARIADIHMYLLRIYMAKRDYVSAELVCRRAIAASPDFPDSYYWLARIQLHWAQHPPTN